ncbi:ABC transporter ATP-binding protein [Caldicellulosiruptoraceae bacterium PP1]
MISIDNLKFYYKENKLVFDDLSFYIPNQCIMGLLGHNGAGKTTLFRLISGILKPQNGSIIIDNKILKQLPRNYISYMPEKGGLYENLTVYENILLRARTALAYDNFKVNYEQLMDELKLENLKNEKVTYLSNGMKKRLLMLCTLIIEPKILILDEPTVGIDPESLEIIIELLKTYNKKKVDILISSHDLNVIQDLCSDIIVLKEGKIMFQGNTESSQSLKDLYFRYC